MSKYCTIGSYLVQSLTNCHKVSMNNVSEYQNTLPKNSTIIGNYLIANKRFFGTLEYV